jgi:PAS domain S-box-containing protein
MAEAPHDVQREALSRPERLAALRRAELLDTPPEEAFERLTRMATTILGVPVSLVSLVDANRQFFKSARGLPEPWATARETSLTHSFCQYVVSRSEPLVVSDARRDPLVQDNQAIEDLGVIAYAGVPIESAEGEIIGSFCAIDARPRQWTPAELEVLRELASLARTELDLRRALRDSDAAARAAARASAERTAVIESSTDGIYAVDLQGRCTLANAAAADLLGFAREELTGRNMHELVHHHHADGRPFAEADCPLYLAFRDGRPVRLDGTVLWRRDGSSFPADCTSSPLIVDGRITGAVVTFRDVSERVAAASALRLLLEAGAVLASSFAYEDTLPQVARLALPRLGDACIVDVLRPDGTLDAMCVHVDAAQEEVLGASRRAHPLPQGNLDDLVPVGTQVIADIDAATPDAVADAGLPDAAPLPVLRAIGARSALCVPLRGQRRALGVLTFAGAARAYDAEDVRLAEELAARASFAIENALLYRDAQSATRARDEVLAVVSHDLRNPVHTITMSADFLSETPAPDEKLLRSQLAIIRRSAARATRLIRDLLDVTRIENGQLRVERNPVPVGELLAEATGMVATQARERGIALAVEAPGEEVTASGDRHRLLQVLDNLLGNALKFTPPGGNVTVAAADDGAGVRFEVRDTGPGMTAAQQANLFRRFWQARRVDRRGVGLGLSIVKGIVDAHGGEVAVESDGRTGTTFRFTVPHEEPGSAAG